MSTTNIRIEMVKAGQPRPYADSEYEAFISEKVEGMLRGGAVFYRELRKEAIESLACHFVRKYSTEPGPFDARLEICEPVGPTNEMTNECCENWKPKQQSRWRVFIREPYCD